MLNLKTIKTIIFTALFFLAPFFAFAVNDVQITSNTNFQLNTFDTAVSTTVIASAGGQVTHLNVQTNYIYITLDNSSNITFTTTTGSKFLKIDKFSGSNDFTVTPACPTTAATMTGTGATVVLRLKVQTTNPCSGGGGGGGGGGGSTSAPLVVVEPLVTICLKRADLNCDGRVSLVDFSIAAYWYKKPLSTAFSEIEADRLNGDGRIDLVDFSIMAFYWTG